MAINKLSLEELIQLAGKVKDWERLPDKDEELSKNNVSRTKSYQGLVERLQITVAYEHTITNNSDSITLFTYGFYTAYLRSKSKQKVSTQDSFWVYATLAGIQVGYHYSYHRSGDCTESLYYDAKASYRRNQKEKQERAVEYALRNARVLLG